ncbi:MAG: omptin family outer membrane protease [Treponema sp.]|nr:omptin family outer membrane protease [Treponema sp.]
MSKFFTKAKVTAAALFIISINVWCGEKLSFSLKPEVSFKSGRISEWVRIDDENNNTKIPLSRLDYDVPFLVQFGLEGEVSIKNFFWIDSDFAYGLPCHSGFMQDYDWLNSTYFQESINWLTNYSVHSNELLESFEGDLKLGINLKPKDTLTLTPYFSAGFDYFNFSSYNGYRQYASLDYSGVYEKWDSSITKVEMSGVVISYKLTRFFGNTGLKLDYENNAFHYAADLSYSFFAMGTGIDLHWQRKLKFTDEILDFGFCGVSLSQSYELVLAKMHRIGFTTSFCFVPVLNARTYCSNISSSSRGSFDSSSSGGSSSNMFKGTVYYTFKW